MLLVARLIPARAGKTCLCPRRRCALRAHPRAGGENTNGSDCKPSRMGSSPRGRGKHNCETSFHYLGRLIPARAGKTRRAVRAAIVCEAHPRAGGENPRRGHGCQVRGGSSPRGRGKPPTVRRWAYGVRLIPARAGKTTVAAVGSLTVTAHPRAGGENDYGANRRRSRGGSSPRGRGKRRAHGPLHRSEGLIPARAGKTVRSRSCSVRAAAHPRAGGEN